jgi:sugar O-acyltransferase (sialic acid O-acetyltransferase NeuD family)
MSPSAVAPGAGPAPAECEIIFWGGTGQARVLAEALRDSPVRIAAVIDNRDIPSPLPGVPLFVGAAGLKRFLASRASSLPLHYAMAIGGDRGRDRIEIGDMLSELGLSPMTIVHPRAFVAADTALGDGCQVLAGAQLGTANSLGRQVIVNIGAIASHGCMIGDGVHLGPGAVLCGEVEIGPRVFVGANATVLPRLRLGEGAVVGAGAVVTKDVEPGVTVAGNPARPLPARPQR